MLITILGNLGSGKTLFMVINAFFSSNLPIVSNFKLNFGNKKEIEPFDLKKFIRAEYENCIILLDEAYNYLESRISSNELNRIMSYILFQSRKKNVTLYITAQLYSSIDKRFRQLTDMLIIANKTNRFNYTITDFNSTKSFSITFEKAAQFYQMYNTNEIIQIQNKKIIFNNLTSENKMSEIQFLADEIIEFYKKDEITNITSNLVDLYCMSYEIPKFMVKPTFTAIKLKLDKIKKKSRKKKVQQEE